MVRQARVLRYASAGIATVLAAVALTLVSTGSASATTAECTKTINVVRSGQDLAVFASSVNSLDCIIGRSSAANSQIVKDLQNTLKVCYPSVHLASPYSSETVGGLSVDGSFGPRTEAAMKGVQANISATADGVYGPMTRNLMRFRSNDVPNTCVHF